MGTAAAIEALLALVNGAVTLLGNVQVLTGKLQQAQSEGRDLTDEEVEEFRKAAYSANDQLRQTGQDMPDNG